MYGRRTNQLVVDGFSCAVYNTGILLMLVTGRAVERWYICNHCVKETSVNYSTISHWYALTLMTIPPVLYLTLP